ncbi:cytochrome c oxidase subunit 3 [Roseovarius atlanticus]|uniref:cytochrome c oxidase subunit 3 n=1 Tax=Roseovarius atlanticus TaxID=1641875 RepID=UPI001C96CF86|nr:cytochrome c oxidase subunit 3 [Roseovarius atlanticus]MBY5988660.1 cytochrome c oxidase subunit 3 [Roseovarius atlanticus]MBY6124051.1 cytochrome c oxidase subunit 3 [Roseovarius atlanticus]MBY6148546.1 cytochrome c oxidase subunit 3 [Roseovarius atlanticus]
MSENKVLHPGLNLHGTDPARHSRAETTIFGFWVFLMADLVLFALLLATYGSMSVHGVAEGPGPGELFDLKLPLIQTLALLASSLTVGLAMLHVKYRSDLRGLAIWLAATALLGLVFLALEALDFHRLAVTENAPPQRSGFLSIYFLLTGTHWLHVACGLIWMAVLAMQTAAWGLDSPVKLRLLRLGLYWHMLDVVWVAIFTFVYLFGALQ